MKLIREALLWILLLPFAVSFIGAASNQLVLIANHDKFPVMMNVVKTKEWAPNAVKLDDGTIMLDDVHELASDKTHLNYLADIFDFKAHIYSIGDILLEFGNWLSTFCPFVWGALLINKVINKRI